MNGLSHLHQAALHLRTGGAGQFRQLVERFFCVCAAVFLYADQNHALLFFS